MLELTSIPTAFLYQVMTGVGIPVASHVMVADDPKSVFSWTGGGFVNVGATGTQNNNCIQLYETQIFSTTE